MTIYKALVVSVVTQVITGIIETIPLFLKVPAKYFLLKQLLMLEVVVQLIEGSFYVYWLRNFKKIVNITPQRYVDWVITTPTMLVTLIFYLIFLKYKDDKYKDDTETQTTLDFFQLFNTEFYTIISILVLNWLMLLFGYLGEINVLPVFLGVFLGFIPFFIYYYIIYKKYAVLSEDGFKIFLYFFVVWGLYGVVATLPYKIKNICYNILDLFAKNFFGIFLSYLIFKNML